MNPFELKPQKADKIFTSWNKVLVKPYDKNTVDPYTRLRVILMSGTEFESVRFPMRLPVIAPITTFVAVLPTCAEGSRFNRSASRD